uniref:Uncharacterized protein n=1 Tax=Arundo donax TaxID=35708 RepID=A0A0A9HGR0_ARUDO
MRRRRRCSATSLPRQASSPFRA